MAAAISQRLPQAAADDNRAAQMAEIVLHDFWRSSASYRVRIALALKCLAYRSVAIDLPSNAHRDAAYVAQNPQGFVPMLSVDGVRLTQSLAIIEYLDSVQPEPRLVPADPLARAQVMAQALTIVADIHPLNNLRILRYLQSPLGHSQDEVDVWYRHWIAEGLAALEIQAPEMGLFGGAEPNIVDVCLVPQLYNARRFDTPLDGFPKLERIDAALCALDAFAGATPETVKAAQ